MFTTHVGVLPLPHETPTPTTLVYYIRKQNSVFTNGTAITLTGIPSILTASSTPSSSAYDTSSTSTSSPDLSTSSNNSYDNNSTTSGLSTSSWIAIKVVVSLLSITAAILGIYYRRRIKGYAKARLRPNYNAKPLAQEEHKPWDQTSFGTPATPGNRSREDIPLGAVAELGVKGKEGVTEDVKELPEKNVEGTSVDGTSEASELPTSHHGYEQVPGHEEAVGELPADEDVEARGRSFERGVEKVEKTKATKED